MSPTSVDSLAPLRLSAMVKRQVTGAALTFLLLLISLLALGQGALTISTQQIFAILCDALGISVEIEFNNTQQFVLQSIRVPRVIMALLVGSALAVSGTAMQGLFRNPLADPGLIGISSGATLAVVAMIVFGNVMTLPVDDDWMALMRLPIAAFVGGFTTTWMIYRFALVNGRPNIASLLLAGIAINALAGSATGLLIYLADDQQLRSITFWTMGSFSGSSWIQVTVALPFLLAPLICLPLSGRGLNALLLGEAEASHLGFAVEKLKTTVIIWVAMGVGASVAFTGIIGFVGLLVPHLLRLWMGPDHRQILPFSALLGSSLMLAADMLSRTLVAPAEMPVGIITGVLGGPFFLWLLRRQRLIG